MGSYRSSPQTSKHTYQKSSGDLSYAATHMCGWRKYMEDASMIISPFTAKDFSLFGIFDGHGGPEVALFTQKHFPEQLAKNQHFKSGKFQLALKQTFLHMDKMLADQSGLKQIQQIRKIQVQKNNSSTEGQITRIGCTCLVVLVTKDLIYIANAGDCRAIAATYSGQVKQITTDHKPYDPDQQTRIYKSGGYIENGRVNGCLNLSRALGDLQFKNNKQLSMEQQAITSLPDITIIPRNDLHFLVLCCDGVWQCRSNQRLANWITKYLEYDINLGRILEDLFDDMVAKDMKDEHGTDNMSAVLIKFDKLGPVL